MIDYNWIVEEVIWCKCGLVNCWGWVVGLEYVYLVDVDEFEEE